MATDSMLAAWLDDDQDSVPAATIQPSRKTKMNQLDDLVSSWLDDDGQSGGADDKENNRSKVPVAESAGDALKDSALPSVSGVSPQTLVGVSAPVQKQTRRAVVQLSDVPDSDDEDEEQKVEEIHPSNVQGTAALHDVTAVAGQQRDLTQIEHSVSKEVGMLVSETASQRQRGLRRLHTLIHSLHEQGDHMAVDACFSLCLKDVLKRIADKNELCRELAASLVSLCVEASDAHGVVAWLPYIIPVLTFRMNPQSQLEPSEDIFVCLVRIVQDILHKLLPVTRQGGNTDTDTVASSSTSTALVAQKTNPAGKRGGGAGFEREDKKASVPSIDLLPVQEQAQHALLPFLGDVVVVLIYGASHKFGDVAEISCACLTGLCAALSLPMRQYAKLVVAAVMPCLKHRHASVRIAAIRAVRVAVPCGAAEAVRDLAAFRESNIIDIHAFYHGEARTNYMGEMVRDRNQNVRVEFFSMLTEWMLGMRERFDYETLMVPYILTGFFDPLPAIQDMCYSCICSLGEEYEVNWEEELRKEVQYGPRAEQLNPHSAHYVAMISSLLPTPFTARPSLGARKTVAKFLPRLLHAVSNELVDWKEDTKHKTVCLLRTLLVYAENSIISHVAGIVRCLLKAYDDPHINAEVVQCLHLVGLFAPPSATLPVVIHALEHASESVVQRRCLNTLTALITTSAPVLLEKPLLLVVEILTQADLQLSSDDDVLFAQVEMIRAALDVLGKYKKNAASVTTAKQQDEDNNSSGNSSAASFGASLEYPLFCTLIFLRSWMESRQRQGHRSDRIVSALDRALFSLTQLSVPVQTKPNSNAVVLADSRALLLMLSPVLLRDIHKAVTTGDAPQFCSSWSSLDVSLLWLVSPLIRELIASKEEAQEVEVEEEDKEAEKKEKHLEAVGRLSLSVVVLRLLRPALQSRVTELRLVLEQMQKEAQQKPGQGTPHQDQKSSTAQPLSRRELERHAHVQRLAIELGLACRLLSGELLSPLDEIDAVLAAVMTPMIGGSQMENSSDDTPTILSMLKETNQQVHGTLVAELRDMIEAVEASSRSGGDDQLVVALSLRTRELLSVLGKLT